MASTAVESVVQLTLTQREFRLLITAASVGVAVVIPRDVPQGWFNGSMNSLARMLASDNSETWNALMERTLRVSGAAWPALERQVCHTVPADENQPDLF